MWDLALRLGDGLGFAWGWSTLRALGVGLHAFGCLGNRVWGSNVGRKAGEPRTKDNV